MSHTCRYFASSVSVALMKTNSYCRRQRLKYGTERSMTVFKLGIHTKYIRFLKEFSFTTAKDLTLLN